MCGTSSACGTRETADSPASVKLSTKNCGVAHQDTVVGGQCIKARRDQRGEELGNRKGRQILGRSKLASFGREALVREKHPCSLDCEERNALGAGEDRSPGRLREARYQCRKELAHRVWREGVEVQVGEAALPTGPVWTLIVEIRSGKAENVDWVRATPLEKGVDEIQETRIGRVEVLEDHDDGSRRREVLEECSPGCEELVRPYHAFIDPEQRQ